MDGWMVAGRGRLWFINVIQGMRGSMRSSQSVVASDYDEILREAALHFWIDDPFLSPSLLTSKHQRTTIPKVIYG